MFLVLKNAVLDRKIPPVFNMHLLKVRNTRMEHCLKCLVQEPYLVYTDYKFEDSINVKRLIRILGGKVLSVFYLKSTTII